LGRVLTTVLADSAVGQMGYNPLGLAGEEESSRDSSVEEVYPTTISISDEHSYHGGVETR